MIQHDKKLLLNVLQIPSLIILAVFATYLTFNGFGFPSYELSQAPTYFLQGIFLQNFDGTAKLWRSTDAVSYLLISIPFLLFKNRNKNYLLFLILLLYFLTTVYLFKVIGVITTLVFIIVYYLSQKHHLKISVAAIILVMLFPVVMTFSHIYNLLAYDNYNMLLSDRGIIWFKAISLIESKISKFIFGVGDIAIYTKNIFNAEFYRTSYHSGYLRLYIQYGYLFYVLSLSLLIYTAYKKIRIIVNKTKSILLSFLIANMIFLVSDGSIFYSYTFIFSIIIPIQILVNLDCEAKPGIQR